MPRVWEDAVDLVSVNLVIGIVAGGATIAYYIYTLWRDWRDPEGYDRWGYDIEGYDRDGRNRKGYDREKYDRDGYDREGFNRKRFNREGRDKDGYDEEGYNREGYDRNGFNRKGRDKNGYDVEGYDREGYNRNGFNKKGRDLEGYDIEGHDEDGYDRNGCDKSGRPRWEPLPEPEGVMIFNGALDRNEKSYRAWIAGHRQGFIVSTSRGIDPNNMPLHRATCGNVTNFDKQAPGAFVERDFIKIASTDLDRLVDWVKDHGRLDGTFTGRCMCLHGVTDLQVHGMTTETHP
jgi:hypothetical protein